MTSSSDAVSAFGVDAIFSKIGEGVSYCGTIVHDIAHNHAHTKSKSDESTWIEKLPAQMQGPVQQAMDNDYAPTAVKVVIAGAAVWLGSEVAMGMVGLAVVTGASAVVAPKKTYDAVFRSPESTGLILLITGVAERSLGVGVAGGGMLYFADRISQMAPPPTGGHEA
jgi:hypothetical protein